MPNAETIPAGERRINERRLPEQESDRDDGENFLAARRKERAAEEGKGKDSRNVRELAGDPVVERRLQGPVVDSEHADGEEKRGRSKECAGRGTHSVDYIIRLDAQ
jgi:hypothetical protein